jgi:hypothetical protein
MSDRNKLVQEIRDFVNRRIESIDSAMDDNIENDGSDRSFFKLCGRRNELAGLWLELEKWEEPA